MCIYYNSRLSNVNHTCETRQYQVTKWCVMQQPLYSVHYCIITISGIIAVEFIGHLLLLTPRHLSDVRRTPRHFTSFIRVEQILSEAQFQPAFTINLVASYYQNLLNIGWVLFMVTQRRPKIAGVSIDIKYSNGHDLCSPI